MSRGHGSTYRIRFDARLVEDAVLLAEEQLHPLQRLRFRQGRNELYGLDDPDARERAFHGFHHRFFLEMELGAPVARAIGAHPDVRSGTCRCLVFSAPTAAEEEADLRVGTSSARPPSILMRVCSTTVVDRVAFERFLDHEFLHLSDMLDPDFGYSPELPVAEGGPARVRQMRERYRVLWDCTIDGRLHRAGRLAPQVLDQRREEFAAWFPELGSNHELEFRRWFEGPRPGHEQILRAAGGSAGPGHPVTCSLCRFPYASLNRDSSRLPSGLLRHVRSDFPGWQPEQGICEPCLVLYETRWSARAAPFEVGDRSRAARPLVPVESRPFGAGK